MNLPRLIAYANAKHAYAMANLHPAKGWLVGWLVGSWCTHSRYLAPLINSRP